MTSAARPVPSAAGALAPSGPDLLADLHRLPAQRPALLRVVQIADDPSCTFRDLADAVATDPALTARLLQMANSAYYGRSGRVTAIAPAVGLVGGETLRGLAVTMALGMGGEHGPLPEGFWDRAALTAAGSRLVAPHVGAQAGDAFCVGLLREVGQALLFRAAPAAYGELAAAALTAGGLPSVVCEAIAQQQHDDEHGTLPEQPLARALRGGSVLLQAVTTGEVDETVVSTLAAISDGALDAQDAGALALQTAAQAAALAAAMH